MTKFFLPHWRQELKSAQKKEGKNALKKWIQLATININNEPRVRTVVFRGWLESDTMLIYTDLRSKKIQEIEINNKVEILWFFFKSKSQFRFKGQVEILKENQSYWENLSTQSKIPWFWPSPGQLKGIEQDNINIENLNKPENFIVLKVKIYSVDLLKLTTPIHQRFSWKENDNWICRELNP